ncbi:hypothetical protein BH20ACT9_BH20ACT9_01880 [soil metagenome]
MAAVAWLTVLSGTWIVYPGYRAEPPSQAADLSRYPEAVLTSDPQLSFWHTFGMEWKEHIGWITPFLATAVAFVMWRHGRAVMADRRLRLAVRTLFVTAFTAAVVAAVLGGFINTVAPNAFLNAS